MSALRLLKRTKLDERIINSGIKCFGRRVHKHPDSMKHPCAPCGPKQGTFFTPYGNDSNDFLLSIGRIALNKLLLKELVNNDNITVYFGHKCTSATLRSGDLTFSNGEGELKVKAKVILGTDGCWSTIRQQMMRQTAVRSCQLWPFCTRFGIGTHAHTSTDEGIYTGRPG
jgi:2-polyprenyl-6-methoxyphenol hydroxylase-like FAD-dependent oxidoreductase